MTETTHNLGLGIDAAVDAARPEIARRLRAVERDRGLRVLFACESGSRAWGFASTDSDFDVRFIYTMPVKSYLQLRPPKDAFDMHMDGDYDLAGWDIRKTAELLRKSNPPLLEWLDSPILYEADARIAPRLVALREMYFDPKKTSYHYLSLAAGIWKKYLADDPTPKRKKYLYILRPLACIRFIELHNAQPPTLFDTVLEAIDWPAEAMAAVETLSYMPDPRASGDPLGGIAVLSSSGGAGALLADHSDERGLPMCTFSEDTMVKLEDTLPEFARKANPVDLTGQIRQYPNLFRDTLAVLSADKRTEAIVIQFASSGMKDLTDNADAFKQAAKDSGLPIVITFAMERLSPEIRAEFAEAGILISDDPSNTMRALRWLYDRRRYAGIQIAAPVTGDTMSVPQTWDQMMDYLDASGVPAAKWTLVQAGQSAAEVCKDMTWPVVVKVLPDAAEHKTELGLVKLKVQTPEEVDAHAADFRRILNQPDLPVLVQEMVTDGVEAVLSCLGNTDFGPVLSIGSGGVAVELYRDITYLALPCTRADVERALGKLKLSTVLQGFRGAPKADTEAFIDAAVRFGNVILRTPDLGEAEINPVLVRPEGKGLVAVDFLGTAKD